MFYEMFSGIREAIYAARGSDGELITVPDVQLFADQYDGVIHTLPAVLVDFNRMELTWHTKDTKSAEILIVLHVINEIHSQSDGAIPDYDIIEHERLVSLVMSQVEDIELDGPFRKTNGLFLTGFTPPQKYQGHLVTRIQLKTKG